jgi:adenine-specific DNA methylase
MFNERQLLCLGSLLEEILKIEDVNLKEFMLLTFSDSINANNFFCFYNKGRYELEPLFGGHHYAPPSDPVENNVWGTERGRGTFIRYVEKLKRGINYKKKPFEKSFEDKERVMIDERILGYSADNIKELASGRGDYYLVCGTSEDLLFIPNNIKVDAIITDPPYYDNVMYSELADFFYVWLRLGLREKYPWFQSVSSINKREIVKNDTRFEKDDKKSASDKANEFFLNGIKRVFSESSKRLRDDGLFIFTYHHQKSEAWASILQPIVDAGLYVESIFPVRSELSGGLQIVGKKAINYDTILVCKKQTETPSEVSWNSLRTKIYSATKETITILLKSRPTLNEGDVFVVALGKGLELYSKNYPNVLFKDGTLGPRDATLMMGDLVDEIMQEIKESELPPGLDDISKIYMGHLLGERLVDYNFLNKLMRSKNFDIRRLENEHIVEKEKKNEYMVMGSTKRYEFIQEKINQNEDLLYIDKIHYLVYLYRRGKPIVTNLSRWKDEILSMTLRIYYEKTRDEDVKNIMDMLEKTTEARKAPTLEEFA